MNVRIWVTFSCVLFLFGCASLSRGLWPPGHGAISHTIIVSVGTDHATIALPATENGDGNLYPDQAYERWGFAEKAWYLEGRQGTGGILRALFWPSPGVVEIENYNQVWSERVPQPAGELFTFHVTEQGYRLLRQYLESTIGAPAPILAVGPTRFFPARRSYHVFHQCHQYAAHALRAAGLPITVFWAFRRGSFTRELHRAEQIEAGAEDVDPGDSE